MLVLVSEGNDTSHLCNDQKDQRLQGHTGKPDTKDQVTKVATHGT